MLPTKLPGGVLFGELYVEHLKTSEVFTYPRERANSLTAEPAAGAARRSSMARRAQLTTAERQASDLLLPEAVASSWS